MTIENIIEAERQQIKEYIHKDLKSSVPFIDNVNDYSFSHSGKMIRPLLTVIAAKACNYNNPETLYKMATMIEYIHTATLLHDDVVDDSSLRRGQLTVNKKFSNPVAVLVGDFIYTRAFQLMLVANSLTVMETMADVTNRISEGEIMQLLNIGQHDLTLEKYLQVIDAKTANLFVAAVKIAGIISELSEQQIVILSDFASNLGIVFQMVDDILDYTSNADTMGKNIGDDLQEGKVTLPLIYALQQANDYDKQLLIDIITNPINELDIAIKQVQNILNKYNILPQCQIMVTEYYNKGLIALKEFAVSISSNSSQSDSNSNKYLQILEHLLKLSMERMS